MTSLEFFLLVEQISRMIIPEEIISLDMNCTTGKTVHLRQDAFFALFTSYESKPHGGPNNYTYNWVRINGVEVFCLSGGEI